MTTKTMTISAASGDIVAANRHPKVLSPAAVSIYSMDLHRILLEKEIF
jgi:hypothetical protein